MRAQWKMEAPFGEIWLAEKDGMLTHVVFHSSVEGIPEKRTAFLAETERQLSEYFSGKRREFDLPLAPEGTPFQLAVWQALQTIPYGHTCSYGEIAEKIGNPKAARAVGMANNKNPISIIVPCHRVIGANGALTGYGGGIDIKKFLLEIEK